MLLVNTARTPHGWTVRATFPGGRLVTAWVEGAEQGVFGFDDGVFTYRSGFDLAPGQSVPVRFHIERAGTRPVSCTVDRSPCGERQIRRPGPGPGWTSPLARCLLCCGMVCKVLQNVSARASVRANQRPEKGRR
ncbi:hypothetical protein V2I01_00715 [Micromonospora sp. BRA006-A]|nr:hypothetical protein [Micromonospora sp. BRA006-A]